MVIFSIGPHQVQTRIDSIDVFGWIWSSLIILLFIEGFLMSCPNGWRIVDFLPFWDWMSNLIMFGIFSWPCLHDPLSLYLGPSCLFLELLAQRHTLKSKFEEEGMLTSCRVWTGSIFQMRESFFELRSDYFLSNPEQVALLTVLVSLSPYDVCSPLSLLIRTLLKLWSMK